MADQELPACVVGGWLPAAFGRPRPTGSLLARAQQPYGIVHGSTNYDALGTAAFFQVLLEFRTGSDPDFDAGLMDQRASAPPAVARTH